MSNTTGCPAFRVLSIATLKGLGYREHRTPHPITQHEHTFWGKWFLDASGTKTFYLIFPDDTNGASARFYTEAMPEVGFDLETHEFKSIEQTEKFFLDAYTALSCIPDPHNYSPELQWRSRVG